MLPDDPAQLIAGKDYGPEGTAQRYLTALLIGAPHYGYNKSWPLSERGVLFTRLLHEATFGPAPEDDPRFVNELEFRDRTAVDHGWLWPSLVFLVELKTDRRSHTPGQLAGYLDRAREEYPGRQVNLMYVTPPMTVADPDHMPADCQYGLMPWPAVLPVARETWGESDDPREQRCLSLLHEHLARVGALTEAQPRPRPRRAPEEPLPAEWAEVLVAAVERAGEAAAGRRVAVVVPPVLTDGAEFVERLEQLRRGLRHALDAHPDPALRQVTIWRWTGSGGRAYTEAGRTAGVELRLTPPPHSRRRG